MYFRPRQMHLANSQTVPTYSHLPNLTELIGNVRIPTYFKPEYKMLIKANNIGTYLAAIFLIMNVKKIESLDVPPPTYLDRPTYIGSDLT